MSKNILDKFEGATVHSVERRNGLIIFCIDNDGTQERISIKADTVFDEEQTDKYLQQQANLIRDERKKYERIKNERNSEKIKMRQLVDNIELSNSEKRMFDSNDVSVDVLMLSSMKELLKYHQKGYVINDMNMDGVLKSKTPLVGYEVTMYNNKTVDSVEINLIFYKRKRDSPLHEDDDSDSDSDSD